MTKLPISDLQSSSQVCRGQSRDEECRHVFRFKRFSVVNERSAMKVNTDGVLLGALATVDKSCSRVLDVGTGTGTIALMIAQRCFVGKCAVAGVGSDGGKIIDARDVAYAVAGVDSDDGKIIDAGDVAYADADKNDVVAEGAVVKIEAVEIDYDSATEAAYNFSQSPWSRSLKVYNCSLDDYGNTVCGGGFDLIVSNPPFFEETLHSPDARKARTRHADSLSWRDLVDFAVKWLNDGKESRLSVILPASQELSLTRYAAENELFLCRVVHIKSSERKPVRRSIMEFSRRRTHECDIQREKLTINASNGYTREYLDVMHDFLLFA